MNATPNIFSPKPIPVLDEELFFDDELEAGVLASIQRCGAIDLHPDVWGAHDGSSVYSDGYAGLTEREKLLYKKKAHERAKWAEQRARVRAAEEKQEALKKREHAIGLALGFKSRFEAFLNNQDSPSARMQLRDALTAIVEPFPHGDTVLKNAVVTEFILGGWKSAQRLNMIASEWLWKRSRFMAGYR